MFVHCVMTVPYGSYTDPFTKISQAWAPAATARKHKLRVTTSWVKAVWSPSPSLYRKFKRRQTEPESKGFPTSWQTNLSFYLQVADYLKKIIDCLQNRLLVNEISHEVWSPRPSLHKTKIRRHHTEPENKEFLASWQPPKMMADVKASNIMLT